MSDLTKRLREAGHNFNLPTVSEAITRANKFEGEAHLIVQLYPRDFDSIILRDRIDALEGVVRECRAAADAMLTHMGMDEDGWNRCTFNQLRAARDKARALLEE